MNDALPLFPILLPSVAFADVHYLPSQPGIYFALDTHGRPLYIGSTIDLRTRWMSHHRRKALTDMACTTITYYLCEEGDLDLLEQAMIQRFTPVLNGQWRPKKPRQLCLMKRISLFISPIQFTALTFRSIECGLTFSELLRRAIDLYLREEQKYE